MTLTMTTRPRARGPLYVRPVIAGLALYAVAYALAQELGLALVFHPADVALYWPPAGLAIAVFSLVRVRLLPSLVVAQFTVNVLGNVLHGSAWRPSLVFGVANLIAPLLIALVVRRAASGRRLVPPATSTDLLKLLGAAGLAVAFGALVGSVGLATLGGLGGAMVTRWRGWWAADAAGILALTPLLVSLTSRRMHMTRGRRWEFAAAMVVVPSLTVVILWNAQPFGLTALRSLILITLLWPAMRFGLFGVSAVVAPVVTLVVFLSGAGRGPFTDVSPSVDAVLDAQVFLLSNVVAALVIGTASDTIRQNSTLLAAREGLRASALRTARINAVATRLAGAVTQRQIAHVVAETCSEVVGARSASVEMTDGDGARRRARTDDVGAVMLDPIEEARRTRGPLLLRDRDALARFPATLDHAVATGVHAMACVPLHTLESDDAPGVLVVQWDEPQDFEPDIRGALLLLGELVTQASTRAALFEVETNLRRRAEGLEAVAAALTRAVTVLDVATTAVDVGLAAVGSLGVVSRVENGRLNVLAPREPDLIPFLQEYQQMPLTSASPTARAARDGRTIRIDSIDQARREFPDAVPRMDRLSLRWLIAAPIWIRGQVAGTISAGSWTDLPAGDDLVTYVETLAELVGQAIERAEQYEAQHEIAEVLQRSMLTAVPHRDDIDLAAHYAPSLDQLEVGGDWFDAFTAADDMLMLVVGDVVGRGLQAATTMGQLRSATRALAVHVDSPSALMAALDTYVAQTPTALCATVAAVHLDPRTGTLRYALAGHPPPLVLAADGTARFLDDGLRAPLGVLDGGATTSVVDGFAVLAEGDRLVLYSDGLVERRGESIDVGLERLRRAVTEVRPLHGDEFIAALIQEIGDLGGQGDDVCVLVAERILEQSRLDVIITAPEDLRGMRADVLAWVAKLSEGALSFERQGVQDFVLALDELCTNGLEHGLGRGDGHDGGVRVSLVYDGMESVTARVSDPGRWTFPDLTSGGGRGLAIARSLSDDLSISQNGGTTVVLRKRLPLAVS